MSSFAENKRAYLAEFFATTLFVWVGCGTAVASLTLSTVNDRVDNTFLTAVALAFGIGIAVLAYSIAPISGGHINPAVTFAFVLLGDFPLVKAAWYIAAQCLGAILGAALVYGSMLSQEETISNPPFLLGSNSVSPNLPVGSAFLAEAMGTFLLVWTVLMTAVHKKSIAGNIAPIAIGWSVLLAHLVLVPLTGCGINPARSLGPHLVSIMAGEKIGFEGTTFFIGCLTMIGVQMCVYV